MIWLIGVSQERLPKFLVFRRLKKSICLPEEIPLDLLHVLLLGQKKTTFEANDFRSLLTTCNTRGHSGHSSKSISENYTHYILYILYPSWDNQRSWICNWLRNYSNDIESIRRRFTINWPLIAGTSRKCYWFLRDYSKGYTR